MTRMPNIAVCKKDDLLIDVAKKLIDRQIDALPIVEADRERLRSDWQNYKNEYYKSICSVRRMKIDLYILDRSNRMSEVRMVHKLFMLYLILSVKQPN